MPESYVFVQMSVGEAQRMAELLSEVHADDYAELLNDAIEDGPLFSHGDAETVAAGLADWAGTSPAPAAWNTCPLHGHYVARADPRSPLVDCPTCTSEERAQRMVGQRVKITNGDYQGRVGIAASYDADRGQLFVDLDAVDRPWSEPFTLAVGPTEAVLA